MSTDEELEEKFGITAERIDQLDSDACKGVLHGEPISITTGPGRPRLSNEELTQVSFKEPKGRVVAIDERARQLGMRRSDYLRNLVENDLKCVGLA